MILIALQSHPTSLLLSYLHGNLEWLTTPTAVVLLFHIAALNPYHQIWAVDFESRTKISTLIESLANAEQLFFHCNHTNVRIRHRYPKS